MNYFFLDFFLGQIFGLTVNSIREERTIKASSLSSKKSATMSLILGPHPVVKPSKDAVVIRQGEFVEKMPTESERNYDTHTHTHKSSISTNKHHRVSLAQKIKMNSVRAFVFGDDNQEKESGGGADCHKQSRGHWIVDSDIANPMSVYEQYRKSRTSWGIDAMGSVVVEVELTNGMIGVGISIGGDAACYIVEKHLSRFVEGQDPSNVELIWDQCWRATINYGRKGIAIQALSALDLAIWDALGHLRGLPVYALLGGKTKEKMPVYATTSR